MVVVAAFASLQEGNAPGTWKLVVKLSAISATHAAVTPDVGSVVLLHHTDFGPSNLTFPG